MQPQDQPGRPRYTLQYQKNAPSPKVDVRRSAENFLMLSREGHGLFIDKNNFYRDTYVGDGLLGIIVRLRDKLQSLQGALADPSDYSETTVEILLDISNYAIMGAIIEFDSRPTDDCSGHLYREVAEEGAQFVCILCGDTRGVGSRF
jgi:hypothetical protein